LEESLASYRRALELKPDDSHVHSNLLYALSFCHGWDEQAIGQEHRRWNERHAAPLARFIQPHTNDLTPGRRLRIGYVSPYFRRHVQSFFTVPLLANHDHQNFEISCFADVATPDALTERLHSYADVWRDCRGLSDEEVADLIRRHQIDILVDLTMHMAQCRPVIFARKPAPVQVCWLAYPGTTGLATMDYRLTDPYLDPPGHDDSVYAEQSVRLPDSFWCYDPLATEPAVNPLPALSSGHVTFGSLNNFCKVNTAVLRLWARVLKVVDRSRFVMLVPEGFLRRRTLGILEQEGVSAGQVSFVDKQPLQQFRELYHQIDIGLDTFPANGHTTSLDAYWMGVPVVTLVGQTVVGRAGICQLTNIGLPDLIAQTPDDFVRIASDLAGDLPRLRQLREGLRDRLQRSALMDAPRFAHNVESAYRTMWQRWCESVST
jgi:predicted O-linked N-acetylglucosamine transferase (SPINDLY family)